MTRAPFAIALVAGLAAPAFTRAQAPPLEPARTVTVVAGERYRAGLLHRLVLGAQHRDLWTTPVQVPVLDLARFAAGLRPLRCGGGRQTSSLRFAGGDGRQYVFRSVDKDPRPALPPELRFELAEDILQDNISSAHPGAPLVVAPLLEAAEVLHVEPHLAVLPDDPRLAGFGCVHAGMLGTIEERPTADDDAPGFAGALALIGSERLFDLLEDHPRNRADVREYLAARFLDLFVGDWDRHQDQWRWARFDEGDTRWWRPVPRDRDWAFPRHDGLAIWIAGFYYPMIVSFGPDYPSIYRLTWTGEALDRRLLGGLERPVWDSIATAVQARLTDSVIADAVGGLPQEYRTRSAGLAGALRSRRDRLPEAAAAFYRLLAGEVDIEATDERDRADIERHPDGRTTVRVTAGDRRYFERTFHPAETREIRLYLHGADDRAVVRGGNGGPIVRIVGGGGDDRLVDSARGGHTRWYGGRSADVPRDTLTLKRPRDWGAYVGPNAWVSFGPDVGLFVGGGLYRTTYGFGQLPHRSTWRLRAGYATTAATYRAELRAVHRGMFRPAVASLTLRASGIEVLRFYGFGNETPATGDDDFFKVQHEQYLIEPSVRFPLGPAATLTVGPLFKYARTDPEQVTFLTTTGPYYGAGDFAQAGAQARLALDTRDVPAAARRGVLVALDGVVYPRLLDVAEAFGAARLEAGVHLSPLAVRVGGVRVWGRAPFHEAAHVGGARTVRGLPEDRFAGDAAAYANAELRFRLGKVTLALPADVGIFGLGDVGRVWLEGESSDRWHAGVGGGVWLALLQKRVNTVSVAVARGRERTGVYVRAGFLF
ncbi:MAG: hypothetical protein ACREMJ_02945 [Gemmatimonadales bacterium]